MTTYQEDASWRGWHRRVSLLPRDFLDPLAAAGALPLLLPPDGGPAEAADLAGLLDGLLLVGGPVRPDALVFEAFVGAAGRRRC